MALRRGGCESSLVARPTWLGGRGQMTEDRWQMTDDGRLKTLLELPEAAT